MQPTDAGKCWMLFSFSKHKKGIYILIIVIKTLHYHQENVPGFKLSQTNLVNSVNEEIHQNWNRSEARGCSLRLRPHCSSVGALTRACALKANLISILLTLKELDARTSLFLPTLILATRTSKGGQQTRLLIPR